MGSIEKTKQNKKRRKKNNQSKNWGKVWILDEFSVRTYQLLYLFAQPQISSGSLSPITPIALKKYRDIVCGYVFFPFFGTLFHGQSPEQKEQNYANSKHDESFVSQNIW